MMCGGFNNMQFDLNRLSRLAGLEGSGKRTLNEASNRSYHDGDTSDDAEHRFGKNQLSERGGKKGDKHDAPGGSKRGSKAVDEDYVNEQEEWSDSEIEIEDDEMLAELDDIDFLGELHTDMEMEEMHHGTDEGYHEMEGAHHDDADVVLEIDDEDLKKEVRRMRSARLQENRLRRAIRNEIRDVFRSARGPSRSGSDSSWMYGDNQPTNSKDGYVTTPGRPILGFGFKK